MNIPNIGNNIDEIDINEIKKNVISTMGKYANSVFKPIAYYDEYLDCIRVVIKDCSVCENRIDNVFTVLEKNFPKPTDTELSKYVGFTIKSVRHVFERIGTPIVPHIAITTLLDMIVNAYPEGTVNLVVNLIARPIAEQEKLTVDLPEGIIGDPVPA